MRITIGPNCLLTHLQLQTLGLNHCN